MSKAIELTRRISSFLAISTFILTIGYFAFLHYFGKYFPFPASLEIQRIYVIVLAICFLALLPALLTSTFPAIIRLTTLLIAIPFCFLFSYLAIELPEQILNSTELGNHRYYITVEGVLVEPRSIYNIYKCNVKNLECDRIYKKVVGPNIDKVDLIADEKMNEVHALRRGYPIYADGEQPREILTSERFENYIYYVGVYPAYGSSSDQHTYMLYKCQTSFTLCQQLPFQYTDTGGTFELGFDADSNEIKIYEWKGNTGDILIFSFGAEPKCYVERCAIPNK